MKKIVLMLTVLLGFVFTGAGQTVNLDFCGKPGTNPNVVTEDWLNNRTKSYAPFGTAELVDLKFGNLNKVLQLKSAGKNVEIYTAKPIEANHDSRFRMSVIFKGKGKLRCGIYGYDGNGRRMTEYQALANEVDTKGWDQRQFFFSVRKPETKQVRPYISVTGGDSMMFASVRITKLADAEKYLLPSHNLKLWLERTKGCNLALGKKVSFDPEPNWKMTKKGNMDAWDLTNGNFNNNSDQLWFDPGCVAWFNAWNGASIIIDLGSVQHLKKAVIRICGGRLPENQIKFPEVLQAYVSKDGKNFYQASSLIKLKEAEYELSNWKTHYFLKESDDASGIPYVYPFELQINADARYVVIRAPQPASWVTMACDELAVIREDAPDSCQGFNDVYKKTPEDLFHKELRIRPRMETFYVPDNMQVPNFLVIEDRNPVKKGKITYSVDLPDTIHYTDDLRSYPRTIRTYVKTEKANGRAVHYFKTTYPYDRFISMSKAFRLGPFYFKAAPGTKVNAKDQYAEFTTYIDGKKHSVTRLPLKIISIPETDRQSKLFNATIDARTDYELGWPDGLDTLKRIGMGNVLFLMPHSLNSPDAKKLYQSAKKAGFRIRHFTVPTLVITGKYKNLPDYRCVGMPKTMYGFCPSYRGKYYQEILDMITRSVREMPPDYITFEDECWGPAPMNYSLDCSRCQEYRKKKGMDARRFMQWVQADFLSHYKEAVIKGLDGRKYPPNGHYVFNPFVPGYSCRLGPVPHLGGFDLYPKYTDELHMSYYGRDPRELQKIMRKAFTELKDPRRLVPFITGGSGAYWEGAMYQIPEHLILEAFMNGASGFELYAFHSLESPLDYTYIAKAMKQLLPFEEFLLTSPLVAVPCSSRKVAVTARGMGDELLLLVGNYGGLLPESAEFQLPRRPLSITDLASGRKIAPAQKLKLTVDKDSYRFVHIKFAK